MVDAQTCSGANGQSCTQLGKYFCRSLACWKYFCDKCWSKAHTGINSQQPLTEALAHKPLMRNASVSWLCVFFFFFSSVVWKIKLCISVCCFLFFSLCVWDAFHVRLSLCWMVQLFVFVFFLVPLYRWSTLLKLDFVVCCVINFLASIFFRYMYVFLWLTFFLLFVIDVFLFAHL